MKKHLLFLFLVFPCLAGAQSWSPVGTGLNNDDHCLCTWNGMLIAGGSFNNNPCDKIAQWNGSTWACVGGGIGTVVRAVMPYNGNLVAVGDFWNNSQPCVDCNGIAVWDGTQWSPLGTGFNNDVLVLAEWNGDLVAAGDFTTADGNPCSRIARWTGSQWVGIGGPTDFDNDIRAVTVYNGELYVGGDFANAGGCTGCDRITKWNGSSWTGVGIPGGLDSTVRALHVFNGELYMGGHFLEVAGDANMAGIAKYNGSTWSPLGTGMNSYVRAIGSYNGSVIAGGDFTTAGGTPASKVAKWTGSAWTNMGSGMDDYIRAFQVYNGELYAGGAFGTADGNPADYIARWYEPPPPPVAAFAANDASVCAGACVSFSDQSQNSPTSWEWILPGGNPSTSTAQTPSVCYSNSGTYDVTLIVTNSTSSDTLTMTNYITVSALPNADAGPSDTICSGGFTQLNASGGGSYQWIPSTGLSCTTCPNPVATPSSSTSYVVIVTNSQGCQNTDFAIVTVEICTDAQEISAGTSLKVYPRPASGQVSVAVDLPGDAKNLQLVLHDLTGRVVREAGVANNSVITLERDGLGSGCYLLRLLSGGETLAAGKIIFE